jgi:hypothetical protein
MTGEERLIFRLEYKKALGFTKGQISFNPSHLIVRSFLPLAAHGVPALMEFSFFQVLDLHFVILQLLPW